MSGPTVRYQLIPQRFVRRGLAPAPRKAAEPPRPPAGPSRAARMLALAHHVEDLVERGVLRDYAEAARVLGLTRARMTQVMNLLLLAPVLQEGVLTGEARLAERSLRRVVREADWALQCRR